MPEGARIAVRLGPLLGALALVASACAGPATGGPGAVAAALDAAWEAHIAAAVRGDLDAVMAIYDDDVVYAVPGAAVRQGRAAVALMESETLRDHRVVSAVHTTRALRVLGDAAHELGTVVGPVGPRGEAPTVVTFHFAALWRRGDDGVWRILVFTGEPEDDDSADGSGGEP